MLPRSLILLNFALLMLVPASAGTQRMSGRELRQLKGQVKILLETRAAIEGNNHFRTVNPALPLRVLVFSSDGNELSQVQYDASPVTTAVERDAYQYEADGIQVNTMLRPSSGSAARPMKQAGDLSVIKTAWKRDAAGYPTEADENGEDGKPLGKMLYKYDDKHRIVECSHLDDKGIVERLTTYTYESASPFPATMKETIRIAGSKESREKSYKITYDAFDNHGNWAKRTEWRTDAEAEKEDDAGFVTSRTLIYYSTEHNKSAGSEAGVETTYVMASPKMFPGADGPVMATVDPAHFQAKGVTPRKGTAIQGKSLRMATPDYPRVARQARIAGAVIVDVVIDTEGDVVFARASSGHPFLRASAEFAAFQSKFEPTLLDGKPVNTFGHLTFNFAANYGQ